jgi:hypothetical protein
MRTVDAESELLIYDERRGLVHILNTTARWIWQLCDGTTKVDEIATEVEKMFPGASPGQVREDVRSALRQMESQQIIVWIQEDLGSPVGNER